VFSVDPLCIPLRPNPTENVPDILAVLIEYLDFKIHSYQIANRGTNVKHSLDT
jgi:hypothetical protein